MNVQTEGSVVTEVSTAAPAKKSRKGKQAKAALRASMTPEKKALGQLLARSLWALEMGKTSAAKKEGTAKSFRETRAEYTAKAGLLLRSLETKGVVMTVTAKAAAEASAEA